MTIIIFYYSADICVAVFLPAYIYPISTLMSMCLKYKDKFKLLINSTVAILLEPMEDSEIKICLPRHFAPMLIVAVGLG